MRGKNGEVTFSILCRFTKLKKWKIFKKKTRFAAWSQHCMDDGTTCFNALCTFLAEQQKTLNLYLRSHQVLLDKTS